MKFENSEKSIEISIDSYEFPYHETSSFEDNNWLNVKAVCEDEVLIEEGIDACLLTSEVETLRDGLGKVLLGKPYESQFIEPTLFIKAQPKGKQVLMLLSFHLPNRHVFEVETEVSLEQIDAWLEEIKAMIKAYPVRKKRMLN